MPNYHNNYYTVSPSHDRKYSINTCLNIKEDQYTISCTGPCIFTVTMSMQEHIKIIDKLACAQCSNDFNVQCQNQVQDFRFSRKSTLDNVSLLDLLAWIDELNMRRVYSDLGKIQVGYISVLRVSDQPNGFRAPSSEFFFLSK